VTVYNGNYSKYQEQKEHRIKTQMNAFEQYVNEKKRLEQAAKEKQEQAEKISKISSKQKSKAIKPDRLSSSKQKDTVQKAAHKSAKVIQKRADQLEKVENIKTKNQIQFPQPKYLEMHNDFPIMGHNLSIVKGDKVLF